MKKKTFSLLHDVVGVTGTAVYIDYTLSKSTGLELLSLNVGYAKIKLSKDRSETDPNTFKNKKSTDYVGMFESDGIQVSLYGSGHAGEKITLNISVDGVALTDNPITIIPLENGNIVHSQKHQ